MMETVRLRLVFHSSLTKCQKIEGLKRCWILLKSEHQTISDISSYIVSIFDLQNACPNGILLSMEGFVLPPFKSTLIFKARYHLESGGYKSESEDDDSVPEKEEENVESSPAPERVSKKRKAPGELHSSKYVLLLNKGPVL